MLNIVKKLVSFSPRQLKGEVDARNFIIETLKNVNVSFEIQSFSVFIPKDVKHYLRADNIGIKCLSCTFESGRIESKKYLTNPLRDSGLKEERAIIFNPLDDSITQHTFYFRPAIAVSRRDITKIMAAKKIEADVRIKKTKHAAANILVGELLNPKSIVFVHYDSVGKGAIDNASGVAVVLKYIQKGDIKRGTLVVFSGCEELSYEKPIYWGSGYRYFEKKYGHLLKKASRIIVVDSVGNGKTVVFDKKNNKDVFKLGFPVNNLKKVENKLYILSGDFDRLMKVYHSDSDDIKEVHLEYLEDAYSKLKKIIEK